MQLKLDENLGNRGMELLRKAGHQVATVSEQKLCSASDKTVIEVCREEKRGLVTLDMDFANPLVFNPSLYSGIAILRLPSRPTLQDLLEAIQTLINALINKNIEGKLWIIQRGRIREYAPEKF